MFDYNAYRKSDAWLRLRRQVLNRAGQSCEGCGHKMPTEVHHLTYDHVGNEFLFELIAVCHDCHVRLHPKTAAEKLTDYGELDLDLGSP